jgi:flagellar motor switch protein FliM
VQAVDAHDESDRQWTHDLTAAIGDAGLTMQVELAEIQTTLGRFNAMKPGDVLYFKKPELARAIINEIPIFEVEVGSAGPMVAVKAQKAVELKLD